MRYCQSCGAKLSTAEKFCSHCGAKCIESRIPSHKSGGGKYYRRRKSKLPWITISFVVVVLAAAISIFAGRRISRRSVQDIQHSIQSTDSHGRISSHINKDATKFPIEAIQNVTNNMQNVNTACDGEWLYHGSAGLNKIPLASEGSPIKVLEQYTPGMMFCLGNRLYMSINSGSFSYVPLDDLNAEPVCLVAGSDCFQTDGEYYYVDRPANMYAKKGVYRAKVDNPTEYELIFDMEPTRLWLQGEYLYVVNAYGYVYDENKNLIPNADLGVWRIDLDGGNPIRISEKTSNYMIFGNNRIYWQDDDYSLYSTALDGTDRKDFGVKFDFSLNVTNKYIFYLDKNGSTLCRMDLNGENNICLVRHRCSYFGLWGDWLVYENLDDYEYYKINIVDNSQCKIEWP